MARSNVDRAPKHRQAERNRKGNGVVRRRVSYGCQDREFTDLGPVIIVSFGACATSGGPYWDAPTVRPGIEALFPGQEIASYVPGCPPRPEALVVELERLVDSRIPA